MWDVALTIWADIDPVADEGRVALAYLPVREFKLWIYLCMLALHTIVAVIITELMSRTYGRWYLWLAIAFVLPLIGPIAILLYHSIIASSVTEARRRSFWERLLFSGPVSLYRILLKEQARAQEVNLSPFGAQSKRIQSSARDPKIDGLLEHGKYAEARAHAWKMMEIARESRDTGQDERYQRYLELIAEKESLNAGSDLSAPSEQ